MNETHEIKSLVRTVFVRHGVDADRLSIQVARGRVTIRGTARFLPARSERTGGIGPADLARIDQEMRSKPQIKHVRWQLENFRHDGSNFIPLAGGTGRKRRRS